MLLGPLHAVGNFQSLLCLVFSGQASSQPLGHFTPVSIWQWATSRPIFWWIPPVFFTHKKCSKTDPFQMDCEINVHRGDGSICPVAAIGNFLALRGAAPGPLSCYIDGRPLSRQQLFSRVQSILHSAGYPGLYSGHRFRSSAASTAATRWVPDHLISSINQLLRLFNSEHLHPSISVYQCPCSSQLHHNILHVCAHNLNRSFNSILSLHQVLLIILGFARWVSSVSFWISFLCLNNLNKKQHLDQRDSLFSQYSQRKEFVCPFFGVTPILLVAISFTICHLLSLDSITSLLLSCFVKTSCKILTKITIHCFKTTVELISPLTEFLI